MNHDHEVDPDVVEKVEAEYTDAASPALRSTPDGQWPSTSGFSWTDPDNTVSAATAERIRQAAPESTRRAYTGDWARFTGWCAHTGRTALPATPATLAEYAAHLADGGKAPSTIERALAAIARSHRFAGAPVPDRTGATEVLRTHRRERAADPDPARRTRQATPLLVEDLRAMVAVLDPATAAGLRDRAVLLLAFALAGRRSEVAALDLADVQDIPGRGLEVLVRTSKTDRDSAGRAVRIRPGRHRPTCPVLAVSAWRAHLAAIGHTTGPLFCRVDRHGNVGLAASGRSTPDGRITGQTVADIIRRCATAAGLAVPGTRYSGHSARRGLVTSARQAGKDIGRIGRHGGWVDGSSVVWSYVEDVDAWGEDNPTDGIGL